MAEELFTDIINTLGKTVKKIKGDKPGKFFIEPYFNPDGSRKIVGGYGAEDRAAFIEKDKMVLKLLSSMAMTILIKNLDLHLMVKIQKAK